MGATRGRDVVFAISEMPVAMLEKTKEDVDGAKKKMDGLAGLRP
jgi:hypothetical protein